MIRRDFIFKSIIVLLGIVLTSFSLVFGQETEVEPNDTCQTAQDLGAVALPFTLNGSLDTSPRPEGTRSDVDFFKFAGTPNTPVRVDLKGQATGEGVVTDPYPAPYDSGCNLFGSYTSSAGRSRFAIPADGIFVLAATGYQDGSYQLTITPLVVAGSVTGRVLDAATGNPLPGDTSPGVWVTLYGCAEGDCFEYVNSQPADSEGRFRFDNDHMGNPLTAETYQITVYAYLYEQHQTQPFDLGEGQDLDLGDMALTLLPLVGSISGRIVDADTGNALPGDAPPYASVTLNRCTEGNCYEYVSSQNADAEGRFRFDNSNSSWNPVTPGTYQVVVYANLYEQGQTEPFEIGEDEDLNLGDIALTPFSFIGSISGRIVDAFSGNPLSGGDPSYASVTLNRCTEGGCYEYVSSQNVDAEGRFRFDIDYYGNPLIVGTYQVIAYASEYRQSQTEPFAMGEGEDRDVGNIQLTPYPIRFTEASPCTNLPAAGGTCRFSITVVNAWPTPIDGAAWSIVDGYNVGAFGDYTRFQVGELQAVQLNPGADAVLSFELTVPGTVADGAYFCPAVLIGQNPEPVFHPLGVSYPFCVYKGVDGSGIVPEEQVQQLMRGWNQAPGLTVGPAGRPGLSNNAGPTNPFAPQQRPWMPGLRPAPAAPFRSPPRGHPIEPFPVRPMGK